MKVYPFDGQLSLCASVLAKAVLCGMFEGHLSYSHSILYQREVGT